MPDEKEKTESKEPTIAGMPLSSVLTKGGAGGFLLLVAVLLNSMSTKFDLLAKEVKSISTTVTKVTTKLDLVSPIEIRKDLAKIERMMVTKDDLMENAPWVKVEDTWKNWKSSVERRLNKLESK